MEGEDGEGLRRLKLNDKDKNGGEVDYKTKSGTAWSHSYLNQKPWHPLSYPNQRRKWIAEQTHAQRLRRADEVAREYAQEQEFFRQTSLISKKEKEKTEIMQAVSFMYVRPPGYNAESAKAAEVADEQKRLEHNNPSQLPEPSSSMPSRDQLGEEKKKPRPKDVFGRPLPTEEEFEVLKNAPRLETGVPARVKPFGIEIRNVKCVRCGNFGHQSGDRECPLKDVIMPNEESRLKRDDPLTAIMAHMDPSEPLKWELKQKPGMSPPRGGFDPDDPNQQIVAEEIFDEYGGFLGDGGMPELLTNFSQDKLKKKKRKSKHKRDLSPSKESKAPCEEDDLSSPSDERERRSRKENEKKKKRKKNKKPNYSEYSSSEDVEVDRHSKRRHEHSYSNEDSDFDSDRHHLRKKSRHKHSYSSEESDFDRRRRTHKSRRKHQQSSDDSYLDRRHLEERGHKQSHLLSYGNSDTDRNRMSRHHSRRRGSPS
ncbi:hypothetical protein K2173_009610 [Erythroxylum novogranatense]|uniref:CBF1-interacting co-repressor CIR N-terminal domain-containing protein n=1 Tax=Erythroxylum novogranatense TaxID=1862640 RepID=A0AAV8U7W5_9ROSI|nr:hypothetical protein K2173_009610 [Erythroxylum novogranatense]